MVVIPGHEAMPAVEHDVMADELVEQLKLLLAGRRVEDAVELLKIVNTALSERRQTRH